MSDQAIPTTARLIFERIVLTAQCIFFVAIALIAVAHFAFGLSVLQVLSGSMEPTYATGSSVVTRNANASDLHVGSVVTYSTDRYANGVKITHRIKEVTADGDLIMQGDNNDAPDPIAVHSSEVRGVVIGSIPSFGARLHLR